MIRRLALLLGLVAFLVWAGTALTGGNVVPATRLGQSRAGDRAPTTSSRPSARP